MRKTMIVSAATLACAGHAFAEHNFEVDVVYDCAVREQTSTELSDQGKILETLNARGSEDANMRITQCKDVDLQKNRYSSCAELDGEIYYEMRFSSDNLGRKFYGGIHGSDFGSRVSGQVWLTGNYVHFVEIAELGARGNRKPHAVMRSYECSKRPPKTKTSNVPAEKRETPFPVMSDATSKYYMSNIQKKGGSIIEFDTRRENSAGVSSYARRIADCGDQPNLPYLSGSARFSYLRDADTREQFEAQQDLPIKWGPLVDNSISYWAVTIACKTSGLIQ